MTHSSKKIWRWGTSVIFFTLAALFFYQKLFIEEHTWRWVIALPTLTLAVMALRFSRKGGILIPAALLASAVGDYYGSEGIFLLQVLFFAIAHIFYISDFAPRRKDTKRRTVAAEVFSAAVAMYVALIISKIPFSINSIAIGLYAIIIIAMGCSAIFQQREHRGWYIAAAMLFCFSDGVIAYGFVGEIPHATLWIMMTYYAAQFIFAQLAASRTKQSN